MREIKFRAWSFGYMKYFTEPEDFQWFFGGREGATQRLTECGLMQFTGLKDFYEGDIIKHSLAGWTGEIIFEDGSFVVKTKHATWVLNRNRAERCEVIGNIYDNPELLEGAEP